MPVPPGARSSVGERSLHTREVAGSKPAAPILGRSCKSTVFLGSGRASDNGASGLTARRTPAHAAEPTAGAALVVSAARVSQPGASTSAR